MRFRKPAANPQPTGPAPLTPGAGDKLRACDHCGQQAVTMPDGLHLTWHPKVGNPAEACPGSTGV
ncbi:hypothetical protein BBK14_11125 [Parafrankia soli]|uniref:Uncharacterized protein n=1 Tax=Parafrankia soli TaxID=2599596 RepID=A0A1S1R8B8_9ACTN|nr:hypothetical protein [Parafrankia soli]OHV42166.1 hypothetical protein BBK14_11125 [Parafrankia soli]